MSKKKSKVVTRQEWIDGVAKELGFVRSSDWRWYQHVDHPQRRLYRSGMLPSPRWMAIRRSEQAITHRAEPAWESPMFDDIKSAVAYAGVANWGQ